MNHYELCDLPVIKMSALVTLGIYDNVVTFFNDGIHDLGISVLHNDFDS